MVVDEHLRARHSPPGPNGGLNLRLAASRTCNTAIGGIAFAGISNTLLRAPGTVIVEGKVRRAVVNRTASTALAATIFETALGNPKKAMFLP